MRLINLSLQVGRYGCDSLSRVFTDNHYVQRDALAFPMKKVGHSSSDTGHSIHSGHSTMCSAVAHTPDAESPVDKLVVCAAGKCAVVLTATDCSAAATPLHLGAAGMYDLYVHVLCPAASRES
jgi:hypothetical protein